MDILLETEAGREEIKKINLSSQGTSENECYDSIPENAMEIGCTANVIFIKDNKLYIANAGDSRAIAIMSDGTVEELSVDHKPESKTELQRIEKAGGTVFNGRVEGNLNLSRSLGDLRYKTNKSLSAKEQMICAYPDVKVKTIDSNIKYILMGCDGVYEMKNSQEIGNFIMNEIRNGETKLTKVIERLLDSVISPDYMQTEGVGCDNMTCILIKFNH